MKMDILGLISIRLLGWCIVGYVLIVLVSKTFKKSPFVFSLKVLVFLFSIGMLFINFSDITEYNLLWGALQAKLKQSSEVLDNVKDLKNQYMTELQELRKQLSYNNIALLGPEGCSGPFCRDEGVSSLLKDTVYIKNGQKFYKCDVVSRQKYMDVMRLFPNFPFAYFAEASCRKDLKDASYKEFSAKAKDILGVTSNIPGHAPAHETIYQKLLQWQNEE